MATSGTDDDSISRIWLQGKQLSQIITYIWRWADDESEPQKTTAQTLKKYFMRDDSQLSLKEFLERIKKNTHNKCDTNLHQLLKAHPRACLEGPEYPSGSSCNQETTLLIEVFGEDRIRNSKKYLSPMFSNAELGEHDKGNLHYEFHIDPDSFSGKLLDPDIENPSAFRYYIAFPPRPQLGEATVTEEQLEDWIRNEINPNHHYNNEDAYPPVPFIPVTTT